MLIQARCRKIVITIIVMIMIIKCNCGYTKNIWALIGLISTDSLGPLEQIADGSLAVIADDLMYSAVFY